MSNLGIPEILIVALIGMLLLGTPALLVILFLALRRAGASTRPASAPAAPPPEGQSEGRPEVQVLRAAGLVRADGSLGFASGGLRARRIDLGVYELSFPAFAPDRHYALSATPLAQQPDEPPALIEMLSGPLRGRYIAAGAAEQALLVWVRLPDQHLADRDWMVQIIEVA